MGSNKPDYQAMEAAWKDLEKISVYIVEQMPWDIEAEKRISLIINTVVQQL